MNFFKKLNESKAVKAIRRFYSRHVIRKLALTILCVVALIGIIYMVPALFVKSGSIPEKKSAPLADSLGEIAQDEGRILVAENGGKELYFSTADMILELVDTATGQTLTSGLAASEEGSEKALLSVQFLGEDNNLSEWNSYDNSVVFGSFDMQRIKDGVRIHMNFNEGESQRFYEYCPRKMSIEQYEEFFVGGLDKAKEAGDITAAQHQRYILALGLVYKKSIMEECYAVTYTGTPPVSAVSSMLEIINIVGYTQDMLLEDAERFDFPVTFADPANFDITVEAVLENGELIVRMPAGAMVSNNDYYSIQNVKFLPNFGAAAVAEYEDGYILVPDGAGALFAFNSNEPSIKDYERPVYDNDFYKDYSFMPEYGQELMMPVYGMGYGPAESTQKGFLAIIESGAYNAYINVKLAGTAEGSSKYNKAYTSFDINQFQRVKINGVYSENSANYLVQTGMQDIDCTVRYHMYGGQVTYFDMAKDYQSYLVDRYGLQTSYGDGAGSLYLEFVGALSLQKRIVGIPYRSVYSMTTYKDLQEIMNDLEGVRYQVQYDGAFNGGMDGGMNSQAKLTKANGSRKELKSLISYAQEKGFDFYLAVAPSRVSEGGNGFMASIHAVRDFGNDEVVLYRYMPAIGILSGDLYDGVAHNGHYLVSPKYLGYVVDGFLEDSEDYGKLAITDLAGMYYADYHFNSMITGAQGAAVIEENLKKLSGRQLALVNPFMDNIAYGSIAVDVSKESSDYATFSRTVPFRQLVMNGLVDYTTENVNISSKNPAYFVLQAAELGSYPKYILTSEPVAKLKYTDYHYLFSAQYDLLKDDIKAMYAQIADIRSKIGTNEITGHVCLADKVYKTTYANGVEVIVNYNLHSVELEDGTVLDAEAYLIEGGK